jgi:hypothetical protein
MAKYRVTVRTSMTEIWEVEAKFPAEAEELLYEGWLVKQDDYNIDKILEVKEIL